MSESPIPNDRASVAPDPDVVVRRIGDEMILVHLELNHVIALNRTGARLWELLAESRGMAYAVERMLEEFEVTPKQLETEVHSLVGALEQQGFLIRSPE